MSLRGLKKNLTINNEQFIINLVHSLAWQIQFVLCILLKC